MEPLRALYIGKREIVDQKGAVSGWTKSISHHLESMETIFCWRLPGKHHTRLSSVVQDFVHAQYHFEFDAG